MESGICRKRPPVQGPPTIVPAASGASVLLWSPRPETARWLHAFMGKSVQLVVVTDAEEFLSTLRVLGPRISMVLMDRRDGTLGELRDVSPEDLDGHRVVMWGPRPMNNPSYKRVLTRAQRSIGCGPEADVSDVAALCATVLGVADRCLRTDKIPLDPTG